MTCPLALDGTVANTDCTTACPRFIRCEMMTWQCETVRPIRSRHGFSVGPRASRSARGTLSGFRRTVGGIVRGRRD